MGKRWIVVIVACIFLAGGSLVWHFRTNAKFRAEMIQKTAEIVGNKPIPDELREGFDPTVTPPTFVIEDIDHITGEWILRMVWPEQVNQLEGQQRTKLYCDEEQITLVDYERGVNDKTKVNIVIDRVMELPKGSVRLSGKCEDSKCAKVIGECMVYATVEVRE